jgi:hypothetical protein
MVCIHSDNCTSFEKLQISEDEDICSTYQSFEFDLEDSEVDSNNSGDDKWLEMSYNRYVENLWNMIG